MTNIDPEIAKKNAEIAHAIFVQDRKDNFAAYEHMVDEQDFARELARVPLEINNDTQLVWKMDLDSLVSFIKEKRALKGDKQGSLIPYLDAFEKIARAVAPLATEALFAHGRPLQLTYPHDEDVINDTPRPST